MQNTRVLLDREVIGYPHGTLEFRGYCAPRAVIVRFSAEVLIDVREGERTKWLLDRFGTIEAAASQAFADGRHQTMKQHDGLMEYELVILDHKNVGG